MNEKNIKAQSKHPNGKMSFSFYDDSILYFIKKIIIGKEHNHILEKDQRY